MINLLKKSKKVITLVLSLLLVLSVLPLGAVFAADTKVVVNFTDDGYTAAEGEYLVTSFAEAFNKLNQLGFETNNTIYVRGEGNYNKNLEGADYNERPEVTITGHGDAAANGTVYLTDDVFALKGDIRFTNITVYSKKHTNDQDEGFSSGGKTLTFDTGVVVSDSDTAKSDFTFANPNYTASKESIVINADVNSGASGRYNYLISSRYNGGVESRVWGDTEITVNGGSVNQISPFWVAYHGDTTQSIKKNFTVNINGVNVYQLNLGAFSFRYVMRHAGNVIYNINGGTVDQLKLEDTAMQWFNQQNNVDTDNDGVSDSTYKAAGKLEEGATPSGNIAIVINAEKADVKNFRQYFLNNDFTAEEAAQVWKKADANKRYALVFNHYDKSSIDYKTRLFASDATRLNIFDYKLFVEGGKAEPVYKEATPGDPSTSYLQGFKITSDTAGFVPTANGTKLEAVTLPAGTYSVSGKEVTVAEDELKVYVLEDYKTTGNANGTTTISFVDTRTPLVYGTETDLEGVDTSVYAPVTTFPAAFEMLGGAGGTIYVKGNVTVSDGVMESDAYDSRDLVTVTAYGGNKADGKIDIASWIKNLKGDLTYKDITLNATSIAYGLYSYGYTINLDNVANGGKIYVGNNMVKNVGNNINVIGTTVNNMAAVMSSSDHNKLNGYVGDTVYNIGTGAEIGSLNLSDSSADTLGNAGAYGVINGDYKVFLNGGTVKSWGGIGSQYQRSIRYSGDVIYNFKSGTVDGRQFFVDRHSAPFNNADKISATPTGNIVMVMDADKVTNASIHFMEAGTGNTDYPAKFNKPAGKKYIAIINNYTSGDKIRSWDDSTNFDARHVDYRFYVKNGSAFPVFKRTNPADPSTSVLQGFVLKAGTQGYIPKINGSTLPSTTVFEGTYSIAGEEFTASKANPLRLYDLSAYEQNDANTVITIEFVNDHIKADKLWIKYGGTGDGSSPAEPAPSYAYLANNILSKYYTANDTVNIYVMQDDTEIYYNSTMYGNLIGDPTYEPEYIGNFADTEGGAAKHHTPEGHFTAWTDSKNPDVTKSHTAKVIIQSYDDGDGDKNYLAYKHQLGLNNSLFLAGPTEFKNIALLSVRSWARRIAASGYDVTINDDVDWLGLLVDEYGAKTQWTGSIYDYDNDANAGDYEVITGDQYNYNWHLNNTFWGEGGDIVLNKEDDAAITLGGVTGNKQFDEATSIYFNAAAKYTVAVADKDQTFKSLNFIANNPEASISFSVPADDITGLTVTDGVQLILDSRLTLTKADEFFAKFTNNGGVWKLTVNNSKGNFLDVTDTVGTFKVADGVTAIALNSDTKEYKYSENGILTLAAGSWEVAPAEAGKTYAVLDKKFIALEDGTVDLSAEDLSNPSTITKTGKTFIGWTYENGTKPIMNGTSASLQGGDLLVAAYADIDTPAKLAPQGIQIRNKGEHGLRFVFRKYDSLEQALTAAGAAFAPATDTEVYYGVLIAATQDILGKDMLIDNMPAGNKVAGVKTFATGTNSANGNYTEYTVMVENMTTAKFVRSYSVQGYIEYTDINGIKRVAYSDYMQASHYNAAIAVENYYADNDKAEMSEALAAMISEIKNYAEGTRQTNYNNAYIAGQTDITSTLGLAGLDAAQGSNTYSGKFNIYQLSNGFRYINMNLDWYYINSEYADKEAATELIQQTDHHLNYFSYKDFVDSREVIIKAQAEKLLNANGASAMNTLKAMEFSSWANKIILTGDMMDSPTLGAIQLTERLIINAGLNKQNILTVAGENDLGFKGVSVADDKQEAYYRSLLANIWKGDIDYYAEIVTNDNGKNPVYVVTMNNSGGYYTTEQLNNFKATVSEAKEKGIPVIVYQHKAIAPNDGTNAIYYVGGTKGEATGITEGFAAAAGNDMYDFFAVNADIIKGIFCGDDHAIAYTEIMGTGRSEGLSIPQLVAPAAYLDNGWAVKVNLTAADAPEAYTANMTGFDESNVVLAFPMLSDIHIDGAYGLESTRNQFINLVDNAVAKTANREADLVAVAGDLVNATASLGNCYYEYAPYKEKIISDIGEEQYNTLLTEAKNGNTTSKSTLQKYAQVYQGKDERANLLSAINQGVKSKGMEFFSSYGNHDAVAGTYTNLFMEDVFNKDSNYADYFFGNDVGYEENKAAYLANSQLERGNRHAVINGYDFISVTLPSNANNNSTYQVDLQWLDETLASITENGTNNKTVFILSHYKPADMTYASQISYLGYDEEVKAVLAKYPQAVIFGGHTHSHVQFENAIMQSTDGFISVDCGSANYIAEESLVAEYKGAGVGPNEASTLNKQYTGLVVEVDAKGNIRIARYDFKDNVKVGNDWIIPAMKNGERELLYTAERGTKIGTPEFNTGATISASISGTELTVNIPAAKVAENGVQSYIITVLDANDEVLTTKYVSSKFYKFDKWSLPAVTGKFSVADITGAARIKVTARDSWGNTTTDDKALYCDYPTN